MAFFPKEHNLIYLPPLDAVFETAKQGEPAHALRIKFPESYLLHLARQEDALFFPLLEAIDKKRLALLRPHNGRITRQMDAVIESIGQCTKQGLLKRLFLESKVMELLLL